MCLKLFRRVSYRKQEQRLHSDRKIWKLLTQVKTRLLLVNEKTKGLETTVDQMILQWKKEESSSTLIHLYS